MGERVDPTKARICRECSNLVTTDEMCPTCDKLTEVHPDAKHAAVHYCTQCGKGPIPVAKLHLITWHEDPYLQCENGDLSCSCLKCKKREDRERNG